jgi:hypothetical protein
MQQVAQTRLAGNRIKTAMRPATAPDGVACVLSDLAEDEKETIPGNMIATVPGRCGRGLRVNSGRAI